MRIDDNEILDKEKTGNLSIGTVSKLTGISVHTLRAWEKRYDVVRVNRSETGRRLYSAQDLVRLRLLRKLTLSGHNIGNVARLSKSQLETMDYLSTAETDANQDVTQVKLHLYSETLIDRTVLSDKTRQSVDIVTQTTSINELQQRLTGAGKEACAVVCVFARLTKQQMKALRHCITMSPRHKYFVVFGAAQREILGELKNLGFILIRAPITFDQLFGKIVENCLHSSAFSILGKPTSRSKDGPEHTVTNGSLTKNSSLQNTARCECSMHIAELINTLTVIERRTQECASTVNSENAIAHKQVYQLTMQARALMGTAIDLMIENDHIGTAGLTNSSREKDQLIAFPSQTQ